MRKKTTIIGGFIPPPKRFRMRMTDSVVS